MGLMSNQYNEWERPMLANYQLSVGNVQFERTLQMTSTRRNYSKILNNDDKKTATLFGDGATVTLMTRKPVFELGKFVFGKT